MICSMGIFPLRSLIRAPPAPSVLTEFTSAEWDLLTGGCFTLLVLDWELPDFIFGVEVIMFPTTCSCCCCCSPRNLDLRLAWAVSLRAKVLLVRTHSRRALTADWGTRPCWEARWTVRSMMGTQLIQSGQLAAVRGQDTRW